MRFGGTFRGAALRTVRRADHVVPAKPPGAVPATGPVEIRVWRREQDGLLLLATASRKDGSAVARNRFRRRVRHALLAALAAGGRRAGGLVVWVRPARRKQALGRITFHDILGHLMRALPGGES